MHILDEQFHVYEQWSELSETESQGLPNDTNVAFEPAMFFCL